MTCNASVAGALGDIVTVDVARVAVKGLLASLGPIAMSVTVPENPLRDVTVTVVVTVVGWGSNVNGCGGG